MRKLLLTSFVLVIAIASLSAQTEFGVKSGYYNLTKFSEVKYNGTKVKDFNSGGFYVGVFADMKVTDRFSLQPELNYIGIQEGLNQIQVPVLGKYRIGKKIHVFLGPSIGYFLNPEEDMKNHNFAIAFGVSYAITKRLAIEFRGDGGLSKLSGDSLNGYDQIQGWRIGLSYVF